MSRKNQNLIERVFNTLPGSRIEAVVGDMIAYANQYQCRYTTDFNGVEVVVEPGADINIILSRWRVKMKKLSRPSRRQQARRDGERKARLRRGAKLMERLESTDLTDLQEAIDFMIALEENQGHGTDQGDCILSM